jgi:hypothetical protein
MIADKYIAMVKIPVSLRPLIPTIKKVSFVLASTAKNCPANTKRV